jgi:hypothetical protein
MNIKQKKEKVSFILCSRSLRENIEEVYKDLYLLYTSELSDNEINIEFNFYLNDDSYNVYPSLDSKLF